MHDIIKASFEQHKEERELLLSTKDAKLTHMKASLRDEWRNKFPEILTQVRSELSAEYKKPSNGEGNITESSGGYSQRTRENANWSDVTLAMAVDFNTAGEKLTKKAAGDKYVGCKIWLGPDATFDHDALNDVVSKAKAIGKPIKLNIAGNGIYTLDDSQEVVNSLVKDVIEYLIKQGVQIEEIRSGGQTGIDEAGIMAAQSLGIKWSVHAPKGFTFRDKTGTDISDKQQFIERFGKPEKTKRTSTELTTIDLSKDDNFKSLNNMATRSVTISGTEFPTVMHAYNYAIVSAASVDQETRAKYQQAILSATSMREIQQAVNEVVAIAGKKPLDQDTLDSLLYKLMYISFDQNPEAIDVLLNTENAEFKGVSDKVADNLKEIRAKFRQKEEENAVDDNEFDDAAEKTCKNDKRL